MFGIGTMEILILGMILGFPLVIVGIVVYVVRRQTADTANLNLVPCPDCGNRVSIRAKSCPKCGRPM